MYQVKEKQRDLKELIKLFHKLIVLGAKEYIQKGIGMSKIFDKF